MVVVTAPPLPFILSSEFLDNDKMPLLPPVVRQLLAANVEYNIALRFLSKLLAVEIRDSTIHNQGLFAAQAFAPGALICPIFGTIFRRRTFAPYAIVPGYTS